MFDNSIGDPELVANLSGGRMLTFGRLPGDLAAALSAGGVELAT